MNETQERILQEWYELLKADDPHHCEAYLDAYEDGFRGGAAYTFEQFGASPIVRFGTQVWAGALAAVRLDTIEEIAVFAETHYCVIKADAPGGYKTESRAKHPNEPFARAIRALGERAVEGK